MIQVGDQAVSRKTVSLEDFRSFATLSGDQNPVHVDPEYAAGTRFKKVIAPGFLVASFISATIANQLPGPGSVYVSQSLQFKRPVYDGDEVTTVVQVEEVVKKNLYRLSTRCLRADDELVIVGEALIYQLG